MSIEQEKYEAAKKQVKLKKGFYRHLASYIIIGIFFFVMNMTTDPNELWFQFPMMAWGIGLAFHYLGVFGFPFIGALDSTWEAKEIERELEKMGVTEPKRLSSESHEVDALDLENRYPFDKKKESLEQWENYDTRDTKEIREDFNKQFRG